MTPQQMLDILECRMTPTADDAIDMLRSNPTCVLPAAMFLRAGAPNATAEDRREITHSVALGCADRIAMADLADLSGLDWASIYPRIDSPKQKSTRDAIDVFIETYGHSSAKEDALLERLIFNPVAPDYFQEADVPFDPSDPLALPPELAAEATPTRHDDSRREDADSRQDETAEPEPANDAAKPESEPQNAPEGHEEPSLMESLAKIYIKQRRYGRALEIINNLSLKYPEKSVYFADQIRFLRKLVNNQRRWEASNPEAQP